MSTIRENIFSRWIILGEYLLLAQWALFVKIWHLLLLKGDISIDVLMANHKWAMTHYWFHYGLEFVKRGLVGSLFHVLRISITTKSVFLFSVFCGEIVAALAAIYIVRLIEGAEIRKQFLILFAISPATLMHLGYDLGRYDQCNILLSLITLLIIHSYPKSLVKSALLALLLFTQVLIHEAAFLITIPALLFISYDDFRDEKDRELIMGLQLVAVMGAVVFVLLFGQANDYTLWLVRQQIDSGLPGFDPSGALEVWRRGILESLTFTFAYVSRPWVWFNLALSIPLVLVHVCWACMWFTTVDGGVYKWGLIYSPFLGVPVLMIFGIDWFRWLSVALLMLFLTSAYAIRLYVAI